MDSTGPVLILAGVADENLRSLPGTVAVFRLRCETTSQVLHELTHVGGVNVDFVILPVEQNGVPRRGAASFFQFFASTA